MSIVSRLGSKFRQAGTRGVVASGLRHAANRLDPATANIGPGAGQNLDYLAWIRFVVPGWLGQGNVDAMEHAVAHMPPGQPIVEIGSFCGLSAIALSWLLEKHGRTAKIFTCDKWEFEDQNVDALLGDSTSITHDAYRRYAKETFLRATRAFAVQGTPHTIECFSDEFFRRWFDNEQADDVFGRSVRLGGEIGFCYIDGNHSYEFAKRDFENTDRALVPGGFVLLDDSADSSHWGVNQLAREIASADRYELVSRNPNYLFRKK